MQKSSKLGSVFLRLIKERVKADKKNKPQIKENVMANKAVRYDEEETQVKEFSFFKKEIQVTYSKKMDRHIDTVVQELNKTLEIYGEDLAVKSIENAVAFIDYTGEALNHMLVYEDDPEYIDGFMEDWNHGNVEGLSGFLDRWYRQEEAMKISQVCQQKAFGNMESVNQLHQLVAEVILELGLASGNFGNVWLAIEEDLKKHPIHILDYMEPTHIQVETYENNQQLIWIEFENDWEIEHGLAWVVKNQTPVYVGDYDTVSETQLFTWNELHTSVHD